MNEKNRRRVTNEVTIRDLKKLGEQGGATALLLDGQEVRLGRQYGFIRRTGVVAGKQVDVELIESYVKIYAQIRTIKRDGVLIARRVKRDNRSILLLTGQGYRRTKN